MVYFSEFDEQDNKNQFATYDQINDRQGLELRDLLDRWENGGVTPWHAMSELSHITGARAYFLINYQVGRAYAPGTDNSEQRIAAHRNEILDKAANIGTDSRDLAASAFTTIKRINENKKTDRAAVFAEFSKSLATKLEKEPAYAKQLKVNDDVQGPQSYVGAIQSLIAARDRAIADNDKMVEVICEDTICRLRLGKKQSEHNLIHIEELVLKYRTKYEKIYAAELEDLKACFRPEVLDPELHQAFIIPNIRDIRFSLDVKDFDSWAAAQAMAEVLLKPYSKDSARAGSVQPLVNFKESLLAKKQEAEILKTEIEDTLDLFKPLTEADVKAPLAREFALDRAKAARRAEIIEACKAANGGKQPTDDEIRKMGYEFADASLPEDGKGISYQANIDYPDQKLCNEIHIAPSGTGLIQVSEGSENSWEDRVYGTNVARITTYSVSFIPKRLEDLDVLEQTLAKALEVLGDIDYPYELPGWNPSGKSYARVPGTATPYRYEEETASSYIETKDGKVSPVALFDLDDLQILYYLMEPVIEPTAQIAAAMNMARFAEERGAILSPNQIDFIDQGHEVADRLGYLRDKDTPDLLAEAARDALVMRALNKIDDAGLTASIMTLAAHTLTGQIADIHGTFPTFDTLLADHHPGAGRAVMTYDEALIERTQALMRSLTGLPKDSDIKTSEALKLILSKISDPLQEQYRAKAKEENIALREAWERKSREFSERRKHDDWNLLGQKTLTESDLATWISDTIAGSLGRTEKERDEAKKTALTRPTGLILAASAVEPALDGLHLNGTYRTRTKGSPLVRYELPVALEKFNPQGRYQPSRVLLSTLTL